MTTYKDLESSPFSEFKEWKEPKSNVQCSLKSVNVYVDGGMVTGGACVPDGVENGDHTVYFDAPTALGADERQTIEAAAQAVEAYGNTQLAVKLRAIIETK